MATRQKTLRAYRTENGLSIDEASRRWRTERSKISRGERGYVQFSDAELNRIAADLGVAPNQIYVDGGHPASIMDDKAMSQRPGNDNARKTTVSVGTRKTITNKADDR